VEEKDAEQRKRRRGSCLSRPPDGKTITPLLERGVLRGRDLRGAGQSARGYRARNLAPSSRERDGSIASRRYVQSQGTVSKKDPITLRGGQIAVKRRDKANYGELNHYNNYGPSTKGSKSHGESVRKNRDTGGEGGN